MRKRGGEEKERREKEMLRYESKRGGEGRK